jgi:streptogramin lyase
MSDDGRDIRDFLRTEANRAPQPIGITSATILRARRKRAGFLTSTMLGVAILTGGIALAVTRIGSNGPPAPPANNVDTTPASLNPRVTATIEVGQFPRAVEVAGGYVWVTVENSDESPRFALSRIDPSTNDVVDSLPLEHAAAMATGAGAVWVISYEDATGARLLRIDPRTNSVEETIPLDCISDLEPHDCFPFNVAADDTSVWVTLSSGSALAGEVVRVDPLSNEVVARIPIEEGGPRDVVLAADSVWVNVLSKVEDDFVQGASLVRIDPAVNEVVDVVLRHELLLGGDDFPPVMAADDNDVWLVREEAHGPTDPADVLAVKVDAQTGAIIAESGNLVPEGVGPTVFPFAEDEGGLWFYGGGNVAVHRLNSKTMEVDESLNLRDHVVNGIDAVLDPIAGTIWFAGYEGPVIRIDLR